MSDNKKDGKRPIIVKKIIKKGGGHHGGAWKVAYADFVTAMMAFFLLLWLLSTSSKATLEGISEYFTPTTGVKDSQGIGFKGGATDSPYGTAKSNMAQPGVVTGRTPAGTVADNPDYRAPEESANDDSLFKEGAKAMTQAINQSKQMQQYSQNVAVSESQEGLRIDVTDSDDHPMFEKGTATLTDHGRIVLTRIAGVIKRMPNFMAIVGHTDASPAEAGRADYSNWELSTDRAQAARRFLVKAGLESERAKRVVGMADRELLVPNEPRNPHNRRITLIMLRGSHVLIPNGAVPDIAPGAEPVIPIRPTPAAAAPPPEASSGGH